MSRRSSAGHLAGAPESDGQPAPFGWEAMSIYPGEAGSLVQRKCTACQEEDALLMRNPSGAAAPGRRADPTEAVHNVIDSGAGRPLEQPWLGYYSDRFGYDFSHVRIHADGHAGQSARALESFAYTVGSHIVFAPGEWQPETAAGAHLLAHELSHVVQQSRGPHPPQRLRVGPSADGAEQVADRAADAVTRGERVSIAPIGSTQGALVRRAVSKVCNPPSQWLSMAAVSNPALAPSVVAASAAFGALAETIISADVVTRTGLMPGNFYFDNPLAGPIDPAYVAFIISKNPGLSLATQAAIAASSVARPDVLMDQAPLRDFEEVKPNSAAGRTAGRAKVGVLNTFYAGFSLPYFPGTTYVPMPPLTIVSGSIGGVPLVVTFEVTRDRDGLLVYDICVETDWLAVAVAALAIVAIIIIIILSRGAVEPIPMPQPIPVPVMAGEAPAEGGAAPQALAAATEEVPDAVETA